MCLSLYRGCDAMKKSDRLKSKKKRVYRIDHKANYHRQYEKFNAPLNEALEVITRRLMR